MRALELENALRRALEREQLCLHYQPQVDANTGKIWAWRRCCAGSIRSWVPSPRLNLFRLQKAVA